MICDVIDEEDVVMKKMYMIIVLLVCCGNGWSQTDSVKTDCSFIIPSEVDQEIIYYLIQKYQTPEEREQNVMFFYPSAVKGRAGIINVPLLMAEEDQPETIMDDMDNTIEERLNLLKEIAEFHKAINTATQELEKLKQERDLILKKLQLMKSLLNNRKTTKLSRIEK
jgi:hypothetical protein